MEGTDNADAVISKGELFKFLKSLEYFKKLSGECLLCVHCLEDKLLQDEIISILPLVQNINAMAEEMKKPVAFSMMLVSPEARGLEHGRTEVCHVTLFDC